MATISVSDKLPSLAIKVTLYSLACVKSGLKVKLPAPLVESTMLELVGLLTTVKVGVVPSGSEAVNLKTKLCPSFTLLGPMAARTGGRLTLFTVMATTSVSAKLPSEAIKVTLYTLAWVKSGLKVKLPAPLAESTKLELVGLLTTLKLGVVPSGSVAENLKVNVCPSLTDLEPIAAKT